MRTFLILCSVLCLTACESRQDCAVREELFANCLEHQNGMREIDAKIFCNCWSIKIARLTQIDNMPIMPEYIMKQINKNCWDLRYIPMELF